MTCLSTLRHVWPLSVCINYDSDDEEWPPPWPKVSETEPQKGYRVSKMMVKPKMDFGIQSPMTEKTQKNRPKTSKDRTPIRPSLPEEYYGLPADSSARSIESRKSRSRSRSQSRNRLVKPRSRSMSSSRSRPSISAPSDFRKVAGHERQPMLPYVPPLPVHQQPLVNNWRRISRGTSRRMSRRLAGYRRLELSIHQPGNELKPLPRFSRMILDPDDIAFLKEGSLRRSLAAPPVPTSSDSRSILRRSLSRKLSQKSSSRPATTPKMPFARQSTSSECSDISFDDLESVVDPDFNPNPRKSRAPLEKKSLEHIRPPVPLKTRSLLPSPRDENSRTLVSPVSPQERGREHHPNSLKLDDLPSAFSSPATPNAPWREIQEPFPSIDATVKTTVIEPAPRSIPYENNQTLKVSTPERSLNPNSFSPPKDESGPTRNSPTPSNTSTASTALSSQSTSAYSVSTAATTPPSPQMELKKTVFQAHPGQPVSLVAPMAPLPVQVRDVVVQRVIADAPLMQPAPRLPHKSPRRLLPMIEEQSPTYRAELPEKRAIEAVMMQAKRTSYHSAPLSKGPQQPAATVQPMYPPQPRQPYQPYQPYQPKRLQKQQPKPVSAVSPKSVPPPRPARPTSSQVPPQPVPLPLMQGPPQLLGPSKAQPQPLSQQQQGSRQPSVPQKPQLHLETPSSKGQDWAQTGSAWREVVWGLKRRTQDEEAFRAREQQVVFDAVSDTTSAHSDIEEASRLHEMQWAQAQQMRGASSGSQRSNRRPHHYRGGSNGSGSSGGSSNHSRNGGHGGSDASEVMEVPVGLALGGLGEQGQVMAQQSNDALLHLQPTLTHDMHAIAEEDEEDEDRPTPKLTLSVVNGMPSHVESDSEDSDSDDEEGEEIEFGIDDGVWEMVESAPVSQHNSIANARESVTVVSNRSNSLASQSARGSRSSRASIYIPPIAVKDFAEGAIPPMPVIPRDATTRHKINEHSEDKSKDSIVKLQFPVPPRTPVITSDSNSALKSPSMPVMQARDGAKPAPRGWGKGLGVEFGIAY